jgi:putative membrane protein
MSNDADAVLLTGSFNPRLKTYWLLQIVAILVVTLVGIPLVLLTPLLMPFINKRFNAVSCEMTEKFLKVRKGVIVKTEKNVPLEQITDLGIVEGPIMRWLGIKQLSVETAGQSLQGPLVKLVGIEEVEAFRDQVLQQRDKLRKTVQAQGNEALTPDTQTSNVQDEILATLKRIEEHLRR